jgi:hypothetical protein
MKSILVFFFNILVFTSFSQAQQTKWEKLFLYDAMGIWDESSELADPENEYNGLGKYCACRLFDKDVTTAWVEGVKGDGIGEYVIIVQQENAFPDKIHINNGYQKSESLYLKNGRPKTLKISLYVAYHLPADVTELGGNYYCLPFSDSVLIEGKLIPVNNTLQLKDEMGPQVFGLPFDKEKVASLKEFGDSLFIEDFGERRTEILENNSGFEQHKNFCGYVFKLEIVDVYKGSKWDDICISDVWFSTEEKEKKNIAANEIITDIFKGEDGNIYFSTSKQENILLASPPDIEDEDDIVGGELDIVLIDVSPDKEWAQIDFLFSHEAYIRVEEVPFLYNVRLSKKVDKSLLGDYFSMYGFVEKDGKVFIDTSEGVFDLDKVLEKLLKK